MKAKAIEPIKQFRPVSIEITFETQDELDAFGAVFNCLPITDAASPKGVKDSAIRKAVEDAGGDCLRLHSYVSDRLHQFIRL